MQVKYLEPPPKPSRAKKSNAKHLVKHSIVHLYEIYSSQHSMASVHSIYLQVLELTSTICINQLYYGKDVADFCDILNNNLILGMKIKYVTVEIL
jgi:hypothetical protein